MSDAPQPGLTDDRPQHSIVALSVAGLLLAALVFGLGADTYYRAVVSPEQRSDFICYYQAAQAAWRGEDVYEVRHPRGWGFYYPPATALLMLPLAALPLPVAVVAWYLLSVGALVWSVGRVVRLCDELAGRPVGVWVVATVFINFGPVFSGILRGQMSAILFAIIVEAIWQARRRHEMRASIWLALAATLKVYPVLLMLIPAVRRQGRPLGAFLVTALLLNVVLPIAGMGPDAALRQTRRYVAEIVLPTAAGSDHGAGRLVHIEPLGLGNQSLFAVAGRWLARDAIPSYEPFALSAANLDLATVRVLVMMLAAFLLLVLLLFSWMPRDRLGEDEIALWTLAVLLAVLFTPVAWHHYYTVLILPYALLGAVFARGGRSGRWMIGCVLGISILTNWAHFAFYPARQMGLLPFGVLAVWLSLAILCLRRRADAQPGAPSRSARRPAP